MLKKLILLFFALSQPLFAENSLDLAQQGITQVTLDNGLNIIVKTDRRAPIFISQLWYQVGASNESRPMTGISHMLEHMMFKAMRNLRSSITTCLSFSNSLLIRRKCRILSASILIASSSLDLCIF
jgi:predicted Zn-dependent peptidase